MNKFLSVVLLVFALLAGVGYYFSATPLSLEGVQVSKTACDYNNPAFKQSAHGSWPNDNYQVAIEQHENCVAWLDSADVQRVGNHLFIRTRYAYPDILVGCTCQHQSILQIPGLAKRDYQLHLYSWL